MPIAGSGDITMWLKAFALLVAAVMLPGTALAQAEYRQDPYGSQGDIGIDLRCDGDRYVVGLAGRIGSNLDRIQLLCAKIGSDGVALPSDTTSVDVGGLGGGPSTRNCFAQGTYGTGISISLTEDKRQVEIMTVYCGGPNGQKSAFSYGSGGRFAGDKWDRDFPCPAGMGLTGMIVRYGKHINALGPICNKIVLQPATGTTTTPTGPARTGRVVQYGAPKGGTSTPRPTAPSFVGSYSLSSRSGRKLTLVVNQGDGNDVFGTLSSADTLFNGAFTGTVETGGRKFTFTYRDAATGKTGSGTLKYINGEAKAVIGGITSDGPPPVSEIWGGPRQ